MHKITNSDVALAPTFPEVAETLASFLAGRTVVAHNAAFEQRFLRQEFGLLGAVCPVYGDWIIDTQELSNQFFGKTSFKSALEIAGIINLRPHSALSDAMATVKFLQWLAQQDSDITFNTGRLLICPAGLPKPRPALSRSAGIDANEQRWLLQFMKTLPRFTNPSLQHYRDVLLQAAADSETDAEKIENLRSAAHAAEINDADIDSLHREVIRQLTLETILHSVNFNDDLKALRITATQLDVGAEVIEELVNPVFPSPSAQETIHLKSGDHIAFSGAMEIPREEWIHRATSAGLLVEQVSEKTKVLVASNVNSQSVKVQNARQLGIPIVTEPRFAQILGTHIDVDSSPDFKANFTANDIDQPHLQRAFPWFDGSSDLRQTPTSIAQAWVRHYPELPLYELSPFLDESATIDIDREGTRIVQEITRDLPHLLQVTVNQIAQRPDVGKLNLHSIVVAAVFASLDASEGVVGNAGSLESFTEQNQNDATGSLAARVYASDSAAASAPSAGSLYLDENLASTKQEKLDAYAAKVLHEKSRMLSLGMGWIELKNDLIPTASTVSLPPEVNEHFPVVTEFFQNYPPLLMTFEEATRELVNAAQGDERKLAIISQRWIGDATLDDIGSQFKITRERVRQLEVELRHDFNQSRHFYDAVLAKIERYIGKSIRLYELQQRFPYLMERAKPFDVTYGNLFTAIDSAWIVRNGWVFAPNFEEDIRQILQEEKDDYGVALKHDIAEKAGISERLLDEYLNRELGQKVIAINDYLIIDANSHSSRAVALLSIYGEPMTLDEIQSRLETMNQRSARNHYASDQRLMRVSGDQWALRSWGLPEFSSIAGWIGEQVDEEAAVAAQEGREPQGVSLSYLVSQAPRLRVNGSSIRTYATSDGLELVDGQVRRTQPKTRTPIGGSIASSSNMYFREGQWHLLLTLSKEHVRGSGFNIPRGIGNHYGLNFGEVLELTSPLGPVHMGTDKLHILRLSSIRRFIEQFNATVGDRVWLKFGDDRSFNVTPAPRLDSSLKGLAALYNRIGFAVTEPQIEKLLRNEDGTGEANASALLAPVNDALGLSPDAPRRRTVSLLRQRHQDDLAEAISTL